MKLGIPFRVPWFRTTTNFGSSEHSSGALWRCINPLYQQSLATRFVPQLFNVCNLVSGKSVVLLYARNSLCMNTNMSFVRVNWKLSLQWIYCIFKLGCEADHSPPCSARFRVNGAVSPLPLYAFMVCTGTSLLYNLTYKQCRYKYTAVSLFFHIARTTVKTYIMSWYELFYCLLIEVCALYYQPTCYCVPTLPSSF